MVKKSLAQGLTFLCAGFLGASKIYRTSVIETAGVLCNHRLSECLSQVIAIGLSQFGVGLHSSVCFIHSRGLLPRTASVHPAGASSTRHHEPSASTTAATTSAFPTHSHQTGTQTGQQSAAQNMH